MADSNKLVVYAALLGNLAIALVKFIAAYLTNSSAMLSEAIHSVVDTLNEILLLYGLKKSNKPANFSSTKKIKRRRRKLCRSPLCSV
jgi:divalent metal cation (Fe/Co/Zn/Cd) transporter